MGTIFHTVTAEKQSRNWRRMLSESIDTADQLSKYLRIDVNQLHKVIEHYPMRINRYYLSLIKRNGGAIWRQAVPDIREIEDTCYSEDPLAEEVQSPTPNIIRRYPSRALFMVSDQCALYCRFCLRKRKIGNRFEVSEETIAKGFEYLNKDHNIREVVLSGGDPLMLNDGAIERILKLLRAIPHIEVIRIHTRMPCVLPQRISASLSSLIKRFHPVFINTHFNHPDEITPEAAKACSHLADAGIPLGSQTVLLKGINDNPLIMKNLMQKLLKIRVKPYYIHHADPVRGTRHFRTTIKTGLKIMKAMRGYISGMGLPHYMIDLPGGGGKIPLLPEYIKEMDKNNLIVENYEGKIFNYPVS